MRWPDQAARASGGGGACVQNVAVQAESQILCMLLGDRGFVGARLPAGELRGPGGRAPNLTTNGGVELDRIAASISPESVAGLFPASQESPIWLRFVRSRL